MKVDRVYCNPQEIFIDGKRCPRNDHILLCLKTSESEWEPVGGVVLLDTHAGIVMRVRYNNSYMHELCPELELLALYPAVRDPKARRSPATVREVDGEITRVPSTPKAIYAEIVKFDPELCRLYPADGSGGESLLEF